MKAWAEAMDPAKQTNVSIASRMREQSGSRLRSRECR